MEETHLVDNPLYSDQPPPLPPRAPISTPTGNEPNSINKQMAYPLVATCATLVNDYVSNVFTNQIPMFQTHFAYAFCNGFLTFFV